MRDQPAGAAPKFKGFLPIRRTVDPRWREDWTIPGINLQAFRDLDHERARLVVERIKGFAAWRDRNAIFRMYPEAGPLRRELYPRHMRFFEAGAQYTERCFLAANRVGKALRHGTRVATPRGWAAIEALRVGDEVIAGDGSVTRVTGVYPQGEVDLFALSFDGVHTIEACAEHRWVYQHPRARYPYRQSHGQREANPFHGEWSVGCTEDLREHGSTQRTRAVIPMAAPFSLPQTGALPMPPYLLGVLLGDGSMSQDCVKLSTTDAEIAAAFDGHYALTKYRHGCDYGVKGAIATVRALGLQGVTSADKFIPELYLYAAGADDRLAVLQGLMDTDGSIHGPGGAMEFSTCSDALADGFEWLAASLGMKTRRVRRHTKAQNGNGLPSWRIALRSGSVCPFRLSRKAERWRPLRETADWLLHGVTPSGRGEATCIEVDHSSHTYVIEHGIVTHNTEGAGGYEVTLHLTGLYPPWWKGRRFDRPTRWWVAGKTNESARDIVQRKLFGPVTGAGMNKTVAGTGLIPGNAIASRPTWKAGVADMIDTIAIRHVSGGMSTLGLKSYQQGRGSFEGTEQDGIWLDEEPAVEVYDECLIRTATTGGIVIVTFTPLEGMSDVVTSFLPPSFMEDDGGDDGDGGYQVSESKFLVNAGWDHVPHLDADTKRRLYNSTIPYLREARAKGIPTLGSGAIYPVPEAEIACAPFPIPDWWPRAYAMDVGWNTTAVLWGALDPETGRIYFYSEHYRHRAEPSVHAAAVRARGEWIPGTVDPGARGRSQIDGEQLLQMYGDLGLNLTPANNAVESGLYETWELLSGGQIKVFRNLNEFFGEYRVYQRDVHGKIVKKRDHLMDCMRYFVNTARGIARIMPPKTHGGSGRNAESWRTV